MHAPRSCCDVTVSASIVYYECTDAVCGVPAWMDPTGPVGAFWGFSRCGVTSLFRATSPSFASLHKQWWLDKQLKQLFQREQGCRKVGSTSTIRCSKKLNTHAHTANNIVNKFPKHITSSSRNKGWSSEMGVKSQGWCICISTCGCGPFVPRSPVRVSVRRRSPGDARRR